MSDVHRLTFELPVVLRLGAAIGRHSPCLAGCLLTVDEKFNVSITGPSRQRLFDQARRFLRAHVRGHGALKIEAVHRAPSPGRGADTYSIICNASITFAATAIVDFQELEAVA